MRVLITGGAGFIGIHLSRRLLALGHDVTIVDCFLPQVHGECIDVPEDIKSAVRLIRGDISCRSVMCDALEGAQAVAHLAAETGTGQSMYSSESYGRSNLLGTSVLYDVLTNQRPNIERIVLASSRAVYGEGAYWSEADGVVYPEPRSFEEKARGLFDPVGPSGTNCVCVPTPEAAPVRPLSFYGITKHVQEQIAELFGKVLSIPTIALRYQNVYGPGQSLRNPYTGILAVFAKQAREGVELQVFEDGEESRDFVYIDDVVNATTSALTSPACGYYIVNIGSGRRTSIKQVAEEINAYYGHRSQIRITGRFREGDIRHASAELRKARELLGFEPKWEFEKGLIEFLSWADVSDRGSDNYARSLSEMEQRGLLHQGSVPLHN